MINDREHPISTKDISACLRRDIVDSGAADAGILVEYIIPLNPQYQLILQKIAADIAIPQQDRSIGGKGVGLLLPGIYGIGVDLAMGK